jgi:hypothetical protein
MAGPVEAETTGALDAVGTPTESSNGDRDRRGRMRFRAGGALVVACVLVVLAFYARSAASYGKPLAPDQPQLNGNFQNPIADALLGHQLSLKVKPQEGLLRLPDPYDPIANFQYRAQGIHDYSLYKGKLYAYFGPAPALLLYIPFRVLQVGDLSPAIATLVFAALGFLFSVAFFRLLVRWWWETIPVWMQCVAVFTLGAAVPVAWLVHIGRDYESSIACGYMLLFAGLYCLTRGILTGKSVLFAALGSAALGLAVAARPSMIVGILFIATALVIVTRTGHQLRRRGAILVALIAPYAIVGVLIALFNYARFGSVFEFGQTYQLNVVNVQHFPFDSISYIPKGLYAYLVSPARVLGDFPYLFLRKNEFDENLIAQGPGLHMYLSEPVAGILTNMPVVGVGFVLVATRFRRITRRFPPVIPTLLVLVLPATLMLLWFSYHWEGATMRYEVDFAPLIVLASLLGWIAWNRTLRRNSGAMWFGNAIWLTALAASVVFNLAITLTPCVGTGSC